MQRTIKKPYPPFHAEHVGSFLRPKRLVQARHDWRKGLISRDRLTEIENEEVLNVVARQKACGLTVMTDGELRRNDWHVDFFEHLQGIGKSAAEPDEEGAPYRVRINGRLDFDDAHPFLAHYRFLHQAVGDDPRMLAKQTLPSPNMLMYPFIRRNMFYSSLDMFSDDLAEVYRKAIRAFYQQGCRYLQLDDLFWHCLCDENMMARESEPGMTSEKLLALCTSILNRALEQRPDDMYISLHLCRSRCSVRHAGDARLDAVGHAMANVNVDSLFLDYDDSRPAGLEPLRQVHRQKVVLGLVDPHDSMLEEPCTIKRAINTASLYVPLQQLAISPKCGFGHVNGQHMTEEQQWDKLRHIVSIARQVWTIPD
ncbi:5-methyltetrahydropteroyltriglutamate--homocysteine S-methyltransferase [Musicola paradisiaca]|uniref:Methionine synthase vitamin-B12 independent n=1 Tax=Musicola paradisiaca (strain Ech703) TaxID=579405 RepID=C6CBU1_MUSP7|nr:5-methyltetrahydropteroyltriglutamate--homocysteine S-methyltransferase [Musicola paradisiaca]ACS86701.1 Methionine synthase vitamin-B12 independent [Musicola paradisiaca Ech703]